MASKVVDLLSSMEIFQRLPEAELAKIGKLLRERKLAEGQVLFRQGDEGDSLYVITQGRVKIGAQDHFGREKVLAFLGEGQVLGEMAVLTGAPRSADAQATANTRLLQLRKDDFAVLLSSNPELMREMLRVIAERQSTSNSRVAEEANTGAQGLLSVVFSPRGGAGKTTLATNLAIRLAETSPDRVLLVDLDLTFSHIPVLLNLSPRTSLASMTPSALRSLDKDSFSYYLTVHDDSSLRVLVGGLRAEEGEMVTSEHVRVALDMLRRQFVHVVVDAGGTFSDPTLAAVEMADTVLVLVPPDLAAVRDARECQRVFFDLLGLPRERFRFVLNHPLPYDGLAREQVQQALDVSDLLDIPFGGEQPSLAALEGFPVVSRWPANAFSKAVANVAERLDRAAHEALALGGRR